MAVAPSLRLNLRPSVWAARRLLCAPVDREAAGEKKPRWDIEHETETSAIAPSSMWKVKVDHKFDEEDFSRFALERVAFRADPRLQADALPALTGTDEIEWTPFLKSLVSILRLGDMSTEPFRDLIIERLTARPALMEHFGIPPLEDIDSEKGLHSKLVPKDGAYESFRTQAYFLALHVWLFHSKQHIVQKTEGVYGSVLCALLTRRVFEWQWNQVRGWMHDLDVPVMSLTGEVQDLQEYVFGFCVALDQVFKEEVVGETREALALAEADLGPDQHGIAPKLKYVLWANVYSGELPHDSKELHELTVYLLRQRVMLEGLSRGTFFMCKFDWDDFQV